MVLSRDAVRRQMKAIDRVSGKSNFWDPSAGKHRFRVLPGWRGASVFFVGVAQHFGIGDDERALCLRQTPEIPGYPEDEPHACLVCDYIEWLKGSGNAEDLKTADELYNNTNLKYLFNVYVPPTDATEGGLMVWRAAKSAYLDIVGILGACEEQRGEGHYFDFLDLGKGGSFFQLEKTGRMKATRYKVHRWGDPEPVGDTKLIEQLERDATDLTRFLKVTPEDEIETMIGYSAKEIRDALETPETPATASGPAEGRSERRDREEEDDVHGEADEHVDPVEDDPRDVAAAEDVDDTRDRGRRERPAPTPERGRERPPVRTAEPVRGREREPAPAAHADEPPPRRSARDMSTVDKIKEISKDVGRPRGRGRSDR